MDRIDDLLNDDEEETTEAQPDKSNAAFAQMRKEKKQLEKELAELRAFREQTERATRSSNVASTLKDLGIQFDVAEFYPTDGETTPEAIKAWAVGKNFLAVEEGETPTPTPSATGHTPTVIPEASMLGSKIYTAEEFEELYRSDPKQAERIYQAGRLKKEEPEWSYTSVFEGRDK